MRRRVSSDNAWKIRASRWTASSELSVRRRASDIARNISIFFDMSSLAEETLHTRCEIWLGDRDSNPDSAVQSRLSYH